MSNKHVSYLMGSMTLTSRHLIIVVTRLDVHRFTLRHIDGAVVFVIDVS